MKKKFLAVLSLVMVLAMESVTVFATEGSPSPNSGNVLYGNAGDDTITGDVAASTLDNLSAEAIASTVEVTIDETTGTVTTDAGLVFEKDEDNALVITQNTAGSLDLSGIVIKLEKELGHVTEAFTAAETKLTASVAQYASNLGTRSGANLQISYAVSAQGTVDENGKPNSLVEFSVSGTSIVDGNVTIIHVTDNGTTENLGATVKGGKITSKKIPSSYSPFVLLVFDSPVPGLTTDIDYTTQGSVYVNGESSTVSGDVSPKTADAYPYAACVAAIAVVAVVACGKKRVSR
jgi:hypothetical protein